MASCAIILANLTTKGEITMKTIAMVLTITAALSLLGAARPLSVSVPDGSGNVTITIGGAGTGDQALIAAWANGDKGDDPLDWTEYADAGTVASSDTSKTFQIPAAWRVKSGAVRFFLMSGPKPYAKRFDFVTRPIVAADGDAWVNTTIYPDRTLDICVKFQSDYMYGDPAMSPFGISGVVYIMPYNGRSNTYWYDFFGAKGTTENGIMNETCKNVFGDAPPRDALPHEFRLNRTGLYIDGYLHLAFDQSKITAGASSNPIALFGRYNSWKQEGTSCSIYSAVIATNGVPAKEYVPCMDGSGRITLFDRVTRTFANIAGNASGRHLEAGNDIGPYPPDCGTVESVSSFVSLGPVITVSNTDHSARTVSVALSAEHGEGLLFAFADVSDEGTTYSSWANTELVRKIASDIDSLTVELPESWWRNHYNVRFAWKSLSGLPYDYEIGNLDSDGTGKAHILTGWKPTTKTAISVMAKAPQNVCTFGVATYFSFFLNTDSKFYWNYFGNASNAACANVSDFITQYHEWHLGPDGVRIDDDVLASFSSLTATTVSSEITLPFRANYGTQTLSGREGDVSVKGAKIWEGDVLVRDFIPCAVDGVPQFYDNVRREYYPSVTEKPFKAGDMIADDGDFVAWSNCRTLTSGLAIILR